MNRRRPNRSSSSGGGLPAALVELSRILPQLPQIIGDAWPEYDQRLAVFFRSLASASDDLERARIARQLLRALIGFNGVRDRLAPILAPSSLRYEDRAPQDPAWSTAMLHLQRAIPDHWWADDGGYASRDSTRRRGQATRALRAWFVNRKPNQPAPLRPGKPTVIGFQVGESTEVNLLSGDVSVQPDDVPEEGLDTRWVVTSRDVRLRLFQADKEPISVEGSTSRVGFPLRIPRSGPSGVVEVVATPLTEGMATIDVSVYIGAELYRQSSLEFMVGAADIDSTSTVTVADDYQWAATAHTNLRTTHEWTTPPGRVTITIRHKIDEVEWVDERPSRRREQFFPWRVNSDLKGQIGNVRLMLELFREAHTEYLDDIDAADVTGRLSGAATDYLPSLFDWAQLPDRADKPHLAQWSDVTTSDELFKLASDGYRLARDLFGDDLIASLSELPPGYRVTVKWRHPSTRACRGVSST